MSDKPMLRCGSAGWSYPHWNSIVYPRPKPRGFHPLEFLSSYMDAIEINTSFYQNLRPEVARVWLSRITGNPRFMFTAKLQRQFTHERCLEDSAVTAFSRGLRPLLDAGKLGCLLMQFPWSFRFTEENRDFFIRLRRTFSEFPLVAEMRHGSWSREEALGILIDYNVGFCNIDQPQHSSAMPPTACLTSGIGYVRLHGRDYGDWFHGFESESRTVARHDYLYTPEELFDWKQRIDHIRRFADEVFIITNNDAGGRSVVNALQMQSLLGLGSRQAPRDLVRVYQRELEGYSPDGPVQSLLFGDRIPQWTAPQRAVA